MSIPRLPGFWLAIATAVLCLSWSSRAAMAKDRLDLRSSDPAAEAVVETSPSEVVLTFSAPVEPAYSFIAVLDGNGRRIDVGHMERDKTRAAVVHVPLFAKAQGPCLVNWRMVGREGQSANGSFSFVVAR
ncbi:copper resistance CopC family protein [Telmatospirillum siberiense]|uniref:CopC domain-containing protein n=1 Tax=Telmatospirillum siberiense TaxID=382514 RepID=A0A2N3Q097_9PROT|nr:copper resistance CopC family protein [Telmatospirillum siberiense]PKU26079.1 hypothetical protein CWS72_02800 [Telmatospirillum siberiense]